MKIHYKKEDIINFTYNSNGLTTEVREKTKEQERSEAPVKDMNERAKEFYFKVAKYVDRYDKDMLRAFYNYWAEHNTDGKKMRFEMQKVFDIGRRLKTWSNNNKQTKKTFRL